MYIAENFGTGQNDNKHAQNMLQRFEKCQKELDDEEKDLPEEEKFNAKSEVNALEEMLEETNA